FFRAEDGIRAGHVTGVQTCALPIYSLGNFIFEQMSPWTRLSAIFKFTVTPDGAIAADLIPTRVGFRASVAGGAAADSVWRRMGLEPRVPPPAFHFAFIPHP